MARDGQWIEDQTAHGKFESESESNALRGQHLEEKCIATDDPRLKEK
jgi:hypothetical protein